MKTEDEVMDMLHGLSWTFESMLKANNVRIVEINDKEIWLDHTDQHPSGDWRVRQISVKQPGNDDE